MHTFLSGFLSLPFSASMLAECALKSVVILMMAGIATLLLYRTSAAWRHLIWFVAMASLWVLPVLTVLLPNWSVPLLQVEKVQPSHSEPAEDPAQLPRNDTNVLPPNPDHPEVSETSPSVGIEGSRQIAEPVISSVASPSLGKTVSGSAILFILWAMGALMSLLPLLSGMIALRRIAANGFPITGGNWETCLVRVRKTLGLKRRVRCLQSSQCGVPIAFGIHQPTVVLPLESQQWTEARKELVLLHELGHIQRGDWSAQLIARLVACLYWINPLVWIALTRLRVEREMACDDLVLNAGTTPSEYAEQLLGIARGIHWNRPLAAAAITMARPGHLEGRVRAILDAGRKRGRLTKRLTFAVMAITCVTVGWLGALKPNIAANEEPVSSSESREARSETSGLSSFFAPYSSPSKLEMEVTGHVIDAGSGDPIEEFWTAVGEVIQPTGIVAWNLPEVQHHGKYSLKILTMDRIVLPRRSSTSIHDPLTVQFRIRVGARGYAWSESGNLSGEEKNPTIDFILKKGSSPKAVLLGLDGAPAAGTTILFAWLESLKSTGFQKSSTETDGQGLFEYPEAFSPIITQVSTEEGFFSSDVDPASPTTTLRLQPWGIIEGYCRKGLSPVAHATMRFRREENYGYGFAETGFRGIHSTTTDETGAFRFEKVPPGFGRIQWLTHFGDRILISRKRMVNVAPGSVTHVDMGGKGWSLFGRIKAPKDYPQPFMFSGKTTVLLSSLSPRRPVSKCDLLAPSFRRIAWLQYTEKWTSDRENFSAETVIGNDGTFKFDDIPPVACHLSISFQQGPCPDHPDLEPFFGTANQNIAMVTPESDRNLGDLELTRVEQIPLEAGSDWPGITASSTQGVFTPTPDDGKFILIHFWAPWHKGSVAELNVMKRIYEQFKDNTRFHMAGICIGSNLESLTQICTQYNLTWEQAALNDWWGNDVIRDYGFQRLPSAFLISPGWKVLASDVHGEAVYEAVKKALNP